MAFIAIPLFWAVPAFSLITTAIPTVLLGATAAGVVYNAIHDKRSEDAVDAIFYFSHTANNLSRADMHVMRHMIVESTPEPGQVVFRNGGDFVAEGTIVAEVDGGLNIGVHCGNVTVSLPDHSAPIEGNWVVVEHSGKADTTEIETSFHDFRTSLIALASLQDEVDTRSIAFANHLGGVEKAGE